MAVDRGQDRAGRAARVHAMQCCKCCVRCALSGKRGQRGSEGGRGQAQKRDSVRSGGGAAQQAACEPALGAGPCARGARPCCGARQPPEAQVVGGAYAALGAGFFLEAAKHGAGIAGSG